MPSGMPPITRETGVLRCELPLRDSGLKKGLISIPKRFVARMFPPEDCDVLLLIDGKNKDTFRYVSPVSSARTARIYALAKWFAEERLADGDLVALELLDRSQWLYRLTRANPVSPHLATLTDSPEVIQLKEELAALQVQPQPQNPEVLRKIQRVLKTYERPIAITRYVKRTRGTTCQFCGELGFVKRNGKRYCEIHHLFHLSKNPPLDCLTPEYVVVLCATCHRRMHYADTGEPVREGEGWRVRVADVEHWFATG